MRFVFSRRFYLLFALGLVPLSISWSVPALRPAVFALDLVLILAAVADHFLSKNLASGIDVRREFAVTNDTEVPS